MNNTEFLAQRATIGIEGTGIDSKTKLDIQLKDGTKIPAGSKVHIDFAPKSIANANLMYVTLGDRVYKTRINVAHRKYSGISKPPGQKMLEKYGNDCVARSVVGERVEPDGYGPTGAPSWLLVLSLI